MNYAYLNCLDPIHQPVLLHNHYIFLNIGRINYKICGRRIEKKRIVSIYVFITHTLTHSNFEIKFFMAKP